MTNRKTLLAIAVFICSAVYFLSYARYGLAYDEGYLLDGVEKIMEGQVIYRDFHHTYAPGRFYLLAAAFDVFGKNIMVERVIFALLQAVKCLFAFLIATRLGAGTFSLLAPLLIWLAPGPWHKVFFSTVGFVSIYAVLAMLEREWKWSLVCGLILGLGGVFRQDAAAFAFFGALAAMVLKVARNRMSIGDVGKRLSGIVGGILIVGIPVIAYFWSQGALGAMVEKVTREGMLDNLTNRIPYPDLWATHLDGTYLKWVLPAKVLFYLPFGIYALAGLLVARDLLMNRDLGSAARSLVLLTPAVLAFNQSVWRSDIGHLLQTMQFAFLLVPLIAHRLYDWLSRRIESRTSLRIGVVVLVAWLPLMVLWATFGCYKATSHGQVARRFSQEGISIGDTEYVGSILVRLGNDTKLGLRRAPILIRRDEAAFFMAIKAFLDRHTSPGDYVLAVPQLQLLYFFYDRRNPTKYAHYRRALKPEEEEQYIRGIERHETEYILLVEPFEGARIGATREPFSKYAHRVRAWILSNYTQVDRIGPVKILRRKA